MNNFQIRKVTLPSGRDVEIVYVHGEEWDIEEGVITRLENCLHCDTDFVRPLSRERVDRTHYRLHLRCDNCGHEEHSVWNEDDIDRFDLALERHHAAVVAELDRQQRSNMTDYQQRFLKALRSNNLVPEDF